MKSIHRTSTVLLLLLACSSGCASFPWLRPTPQGPLPPAAFTAPPSLNDIVFAVNANSDRVQQLQTTGATVSVPGLPSLPAEVALERPRRLRLTAAMPILGGGRVLDMGSNDERFWLWGKLMPQQSVFTARHDQFAHTTAHAMVPVEPEWLIEALGVVRLDPNLRHEGPRVTAGRIEIRSQIPTPRGNLTRVLVLDDRYAWVLEQHLQDVNGQVLATARTSKHRFYPAAGVSLPHQVNIQFMPGQPTQTAFEINVANYSVNRLYDQAEQLWVMPPFQGYPVVDLAAPQAGQMPTATQRGIPVHVPPSYPATGFRPAYRGAAWR